MRQEAYDLIETVRSLGVEVTAASGPRAIKIATDADTFWSRLKDVRLALDAFDRAGGSSMDVNTPQPDEKLKKALDAILRLYELQGGNIAEAIAVVQDALETEPVSLSKEGEKATGKKKKEYSSLPVFAPNGIKNKKKYKLRIRLLPKMPGNVSLDELRRLGFDVSYVESISGNTLAAAPQERNNATPPTPRSNPFGK